MTRHVEHDPPVGGEMNNAAEDNTGVPALPFDFGWPVPVAGRGLRLLDEVGCESRVDWSPFAFPAVPHAA